MKRLAAGAGALAATLLLAACGGSGGPGPKPSAASVDAAVIRGWSRAIDRGDFDRAGAFFAPGAIVEQVGTMRLERRADAVAFSAGLPCRADVTDVKDEGPTSLASFRLRRGRDGACADGGTAQVRFKIRGGKILEWRQLPAPPAPPPSGRLTSLEPPLA